jgi:hypothetical protein
MLFPHIDKQVHTMAGTSEIPLKLKTAYLKGKIKKILILLSKNYTRIFLLVFIEYFI